MATCLRQTTPCCSNLWTGWPHTWNTWSSLWAWKTGGIIREFHANLEKSCNKQNNITRCGFRGAKWSEICLLLRLCLDPCWGIFGAPQNYHDSTLSVLSAGAAAGVRQWCRELQADQAGPRRTATACWEVRVVGLQVEDWRQSGKESRRCTGINWGNVDSCWGLSSQLHFYWTLLLLLIF